MKSLTSQAIERLRAGGPGPEIPSEHFSGPPIDPVPIPRSGTLRRVDGVEAAAAVPGVAGVEISILAGRPVRTLPEGDRYLGFVFARGDDPASVEASLRVAHVCLDVVIDEP